MWTRMLLLLSQSNLVLFLNLVETQWAAVRGIADLEYNRQMNESSEVRRSLYLEP